MTGRIPLEDLERELQDDRFALQYARYNKRADIAFARQLCSPFRRFWRIYYRLRSKLNIDY